MTDETMTISERRKYLTKMQMRYRAADRAERGVSLDTSGRSVVGQFDPFDLVTTGPN